METRERTKEELRTIVEAAGLRLSAEEFDSLVPVLNAVLSQTDRLSDIVFDDKGPATILDPRKP
jgi:hypothetical protein